ncbi:MAG: hypothetical protein GC129_03795 [Proteobacteria bacterium]|nr:hypothetical protein [Pseudomonadota bacterium]
MKQQKPLLEAALAYLARREHGTAELRRKLQQKGYPLPEVDTVLAALLQKNYLNDQRYAAARGSSRAQGSKWGAAKIRQELSSKGLAAETVSSTMESLNESEDWLATAQKLLQRKFPQPLPEAESADPALGRAEAYKALQKEKSKRISYLTRRGFSLQQALQALNLTDLDAPEGEV